MAKTPFRLRSQGATFKEIGSSPVLQTKSHDWNYDDSLGFFPDPNRPVSSQVKEEVKNNIKKKKKAIELAKKIDKEQTKIYSDMLNIQNLADGVGMTGIP